MNGPYGNMFPYTNFHEMNLDWMIQIAKDFLDQYTNIQDTIDTGLNDLQEKYDTLAGLLDSWYNEHSEDIAGQLASALEDLNAWYTLHEGYLDDTLATNIAAFNSAAELKAQQVIEDIPDDYTELCTEVVMLQNQAAIHDGVGLQYGYMPLLYSAEQGGFGGSVGTTYTETTATGRTRLTDFVPISKFSAIYIHLDDYVSFKWYMIGLDASNVIKWSSGFKQEDATILGSSLAATGATKITIMIASTDEGHYTAGPATWEHAFISYRPSVNANFSFRRIIASGEDLNDIYNEGVYYYSTSTHPDHEPFGTGAIIMVYKTDTTDRVVQVAYGYGADYDVSHHVAHRERTGGTWSQWRSFSTSRGLQGKTFSVLGDSYSAYQGYIPEGYAYHYPAGSVDTPGEMWWGELAASTGMTMLVCNAYSGSALSYTGQFPDRPSGASAERLANLGDSPDIIIIMMGLNDFNQNAYPGTYKIGDEMPADISNFRNALTTALNTIQGDHPSAEVVLCTIPEVYPYRLVDTATSNPFWTNSHAGSIETLNEAILELGRAYGVKIADLRDAFTPANRSSWTHDGGTSDSLNYTFGVHPNHGGMIRIAQIIENVLH